MMKTSLKPDLENDRILATSFYSGALPGLLTPVTHPQQLCAY